MTLLWVTGARISEVLALTPNHFRTLSTDDFGVTLQTLKKRGRPRTRLRGESLQRFVPILDLNAQQRIINYLEMSRGRASERLFTMSRQSVDNHIKAACRLAGFDWIKASAHTFRHSFAIHLLIHARPLKFISKMLGHSSIQYTEIYTNVLTSDMDHFFEGIEFCSLEYSLR